jgi:hypothetical protein
MQQNMDHNSFKLRLTYVEQTFKKKKFWTCSSHCVYTNVFSLLDYSQHNN